MYYLKFPYPTFWKMHSKCMLYIYTFVYDLISNKTLYMILIILYLQELSLESLHTHWQSLVEVSTILSVTNKEKNLKGFLQPYIWLLLTFNFIKFKGTFWPDWAKNSEEMLSLKIFTDIHNRPPFHKHCCKKMC